MKTRGITVLVICFIFTSVTRASNGIYSLATTGFLDPHATHATRITNPPSKQPGFFQRLKNSIWGKGLGKRLSGITKKQKRQARWSLVLGLSSLAFLLVPPLTLLALPAAIAGLIFGIKSVDGNSNVEGILGIISSGITMCIFLVVAIALATFLASGI